MRYYELVQQVRRALADAPDVIVEPRFSITTSELWGAAVRAGTMFGGFFLALVALFLTGVIVGDYVAVGIGAVSLLLMFMFDVPLVEWLTAAFILEDREKEVKKRGNA